MLSCPLRPALHLCKVQQSSTLLTWTLKVGVCEFREQLPVSLDSDTPSLVRRCGETLDEYEHSDTRRTFGSNPLLRIKPNRGMAKAG